MTNQRKAASDMSRIAAQHPKNSIFFSFALNSRAVAERRTSPKESLFFFSSTETLLIESHENHGSMSVMTLCSSSFFFLIHSQMIYIIPSSYSGWTESGGRKERKRGKTRRGKEREGTANLCLQIFFSDLSSHKLGPAFC